MKCSTELRVLYELRIEIGELKGDDKSLLPISSVLVVETKSSKHSSEGEPSSGSL